MIYGVLIYNNDTGVLEERVNNRIESLKGQSGFAPGISGICESQADLENANELDRIDNTRLKQLCLLYNDIAKQFAIGPEEINTLVILATRIPGTGTVKDRIDRGNFREEIALQFMEMKFDVAKCDITKIPQNTLRKYIFYPFLYSKFKINCSNEFRIYKEKQEAAKGKK